VFPGGIEAALSQCLELSRKHDAAWRVSSAAWVSAAWLSRGRRNLARLERQRAADQLTTDEEKTFTVAALGPVGHVYFAEAKTDAQLGALANRLVSEGRIPGVLLQTRDGRATWFHALGESRIPEDVPARLPHPPALREQIAKDLAGLLVNPNVGDLTLLGWGPGAALPVSFAPERGAHGGFGPNETQGFALLPAHTPLPAGTEHFIRPGDLRTAALHHVGRGALAARPAATARRADFRLMTYNTHGCGGMDGRVSPRRVARVVRTQIPDIVAFAGTRSGRRRSRSEDQAAIIAREAGMEAVFCPTVTRGDEHYGHALLSRWPMEIVKRARLPQDSASWWQEPRCALWVRVDVAGLIINVITTHLGLGAASDICKWKRCWARNGWGRFPPPSPRCSAATSTVFPAAGPIGWPRGG